MAVSKNFAGSTYQIPQNKDPKSTNWGTQVSNFLQALADYALPRTGGSNQLTAEMNFSGGSFAGAYGVKLPYIKAARDDSFLPSAGVVRLGNADTVQWKGSGSDLSLSVSGSDRLQFAGTNLYQPADAASNNTVSKLVLRDSNGDFSAGTITATSFNGPITGNAATATKWQTARTITLGTDLTGSVSIDGSADVTLNATIAANSVALGTDTTGDYVQSISASGAGISISGGTGEGSTPAVSLDATLNALAGYNTNGLLTQTAADTFAGRTITGTTNKIVVTDGDGILGNPTLNIGSDVVTLTDTQSLTNKTIVSSTAATTGALQLPTGTTLERPTVPINGYVRYNSDTTAFEGYASGAWSAIGGGGTVDRVMQASHGFSLGDILYLNGATYTKAIATASNTAEVVGMVSRVIDGSNFEITLSGEVTGLSSLTAGTVYFLSDSSAGAYTATEPTTLGYVSVPLGVASSTTSFYVTLKRGNVIGGTNARTQIILLNNTTGNIQDVSAYEAGELTGWVSITNTTAANSLRFYVRAPFAKNGAASNWNISPSYMGDTPPSGFSLSITSGGVIQYTMPNVSGFSAANINYALNAPAVGATFPLSVQGSSVTNATTSAAGVITLKAPTVSRFTSGSSTYTVPSGVFYLKVRMIGGGGGGAGSWGGSKLPSAPGSGGNGGNTTFGASLLTATGGDGATATAGGDVGGAQGGAVTINSPAITIVGLKGGSGCSGSDAQAASTYLAGAHGASTIFSSGGAGGQGNATGFAAIANTGAGGGGGGTGSTGINGAGGGAGGYIEALITSPSSSYSVSVGAGGAGGTAGNGGFAGGAGGSGVIIIEEYYY